MPSGMGGIYLYAGTAAGLQRNPDCFCGWQPVGGLPTKQPVVAFAADPTLWPLMVVALADGVRKSTDGGRMWEPLPGAPSHVAALAVHPEKHEVVFAGTRDGRIVVSGDGGVSWQATR